jgi:hypothetical protein
MISCEVVDAGCTTGCWPVRSVPFDEDAGCRLPALVVTGCSDQSVCTEDLNCYTTHNALYDRVLRSASCDAGMR